MNEYTESFYVALCLCCNRMNTWTNFFLFFPFELDLKLKWILFLLLTNAKYNLLAFKLLLEHIFSPFACNMFVCVFTLFILNLPIARVRKPSATSHLGFFMMMLKQIAQVFIKLTLA